MVWFGVGSVVVSSLLFLSYRRNKFDLVLIFDLLTRKLLITVKLFATRACLKSSVGDVLKLWD